MRIDKALANRPGQFVLATAGVESATRFYGAIFGWRSDNDGAFRIDGDLVARVEYGEGGWMPYLSVDDVSAVVGVAVHDGATAASTTVGPAGISAVITDPTGAPLGLWERDSGEAVAVMGEVGSVVWTEEKTFEQAAAVAFHESLFGFHAVGPSGPGAVRVLLGDGPPFGGVMQFDDRWAADEKPHWLVYFKVEDVTVTLDAAVAAGGSVWFTPFDTPLGEMAYLRDPEGNAFAVVGVSEQGRALSGGGGQ